ncbi:MAG: HAD family hydrolase [Clostridiales bacterium]|nr:HAD family hydrolase [Clostridiales bacterium]
MKTVLFDLDGTLLPMDQNVFMKAYFGGITKKLSPRGYEPKQLVDGIWRGTAAMVKNDGTKTNEQVFWAAFSRIFGEKAYSDIPYFDEFYKTDFNLIKNACGFDRKAGETIKNLKSKGYKIIVATNPFFPMIAQQSRLQWAGIDLRDVDYITSYENSRYCKPNILYYSEIMNVFGLDPRNCVMVGNDVTEDMIAEKLGMRVFLMTRCLINKSNVNIDNYAHGGFDELSAFIDCEVAL